MAGNSNVMEEIMNTNQKIALDFGQKNPPITVWAKQGDNQSRYIEITPLNCGQGYKLESGVRAEFRVTKHDKKVAVHTATISNGVIIVELTNQILAAAGDATAEVALLKGAEILSTQTFTIQVEKSAYNADKVESSDDYKALLETIKSINNLNEVVESAQSIINSFKIATGNLTIVPDEGGVPKREHVDFPEGLFTKTPVVFVNPKTTVPGTLVLGASVTNITKAGCDIYLTRTSASSTGVCWLAIQV